jgi:hypothetical protein
MNEIYSVAKVPALAGVVHGVDTSHYSEAVLYKVDQSTLRAPTSQGIACMHVPADGWQPHDAQCGCRHKHRTRSALQVCCKSNAAALCKGHPASRLAAALCGHTRTHT